MTSDDYAPASLGQLRSLRRWIWVAAAWAAAASAIALIALLDEDAPPQQRPVDTSGPRIAALEARLGDRMASLEERLGQAAVADDVTKLERRLRRAEADAEAARRTASRSGNTIEEIETRVQDLEDRVDELETAADKEN